MDWPPPYPYPLFLLQNKLTAPYLSFDSFYFLWQCYQILLFDICYLTHFNESLGWPYSWGLYEDLRSVGMWVWEGQSPNPPLRRVSAMSAFNISAVSIFVSNPPTKQADVILLTLPYNIVFVKNMWQLRIAVWGDQRNGLREGATIIFTFIFLSHYWYWWSLYTCLSTCFSVSYLSSQYMQIR